MQIKGPLGPSCKSLGDKGHVMGKGKAFSAEDEVWGSTGRSAWSRAGNGAGAPFDALELVNSLVDSSNSDAFP